MWTKKLQESIEKNNYKSIISRTELVYGSDQDILFAWYAIVRVLFSSLKREKQFAFNAI